jgi:Trk K+ transport system NAD-binding subunit
VFDPTLAQQLEVSFDVRRAVGMSALSAPVLAGAALGEQLVGSFTLDGALFVVGHLALDATSPLAGRSVQQVRAAHGLAALVRGAADQPPEIVPSPDVALAAGDRVTVVGTAAAWDSATGDPRLAEAPASAVVRALHGLHSALSPAQALGFLRQAWATTSVGLRTVFVLLNLLILLSVFVFHAAMELSWDDALYFVVTTVTTVGYGDITPRDAHTGVKLYAVLLMVLGSATIATLYSIITDFIVTARFQQLLGRQRVPNQDHIVVVGLGNVGYRVVDELRRARVGVVAIERDPAGPFVETVRAHTPVIVGDARLRDTLEKAGVARARAVIAATHDETVNLSVGLGTAHLAQAAGRHVLTVARLFDADLARKVQATMRIDRVLSPSTIAAPTFVAAALYPDVRYAFELDDHLLVICHRAVGADWAGLSPARLRAEHDAIVLLRRGAADRAYAMADADAPLALAEQILAVEWRPLTS